jgi:hypothetical protein
VRNQRTPLVSLAVAATVAVLALVPGVVAAADPPPPAVPPAAATAGTPAPAATADVQAPAGEADDEDLSPTPMQPDFYLVNLPTNLRLPSHKLAFRVTHRFTRPLNQGSFGGSLGDFFGLDSGAQIGLELRFAPMRGMQVGLYRTSDKTIDFFGSYNVCRTLGGLPISLSATASVEGTNNFKDSYSPSLGAVMTATLGSRLALTLVPTWVNNTSPLPKALVDHNNTAYLGFGGRVRMTRSSYVVLEVTPRIAGYKGGDPLLINTSKYDEGRPLASLAIEKQLGGHVFQLNFSNGFASTPANIGRGAASGRTNWYLGFNISRKFY